MPVGGAECPGLRQRRRGGSGRLRVLLPQARRVRARPRPSLLGTVAGWGHLGVDFLTPGSTVGLWKGNHFSCVWGSSPRDDVSPGTGPGRARVATDPWPCGLSLVHTVSSTADVTVVSPFAQAVPWGGVRPDPTLLTPAQALGVAAAAFPGGRKLKGDFTTLSSGSVHRSAGTRSSWRPVSSHTWGRMACRAGNASCLALPNPGWGAASPPRQRSGGWWQLTWSALWTTTGTSSEAEHVRRGHSLLPATSG